MSLDSTQGLNVRFHPKRSFKSLETLKFNGCFRPIAVVQRWSSDRQLWMIAAAVYGVIAMIQFSKLARPTQLSSDHGWVAEPPAGWAESLIVRTAAQPAQSSSILFYRDRQHARGGEGTTTWDDFIVTNEPWLYFLRCCPLYLKASQLVRDRRIGIDRKERV